MADSSDNEAPDVGSGPSMQNMPQTLALKKPTFDNCLNACEKYNWLLHILFLRQDYDECLRLIDK